jgi:uncharacterized protein involved in outer membrane biogenesis
MKRGWKIGLLALACVVLLLVGIGQFWLGAFIKAGVERVGPSITRTSVKLGGVGVSLLSGRAHLKGLVVGNPAGLRAPNAFTLNEANVQVNWKSVLEDTVVIETIEVNGPEITFESRLSGSNLSTIRDNVQAFTSSASAAKASGAARSDRASRKKVHVKRFILRDGRVTVWLGAGSLESKALTVPLPDVQLKDIGKESDGATPEQVTAAVFTAIYNAALRTVTGAAKPLEKGTEAIGESVRQLGEAGEKAASKALESVRGLLDKR